MASVLLLVAVIGAGCGSAVGARWVADTLARRFALGWWIREAFNAALLAALAIGESAIYSGGAPGLSVLAAGFGIMAQRLADDWRALRTPINRLGNYKRRRPTRAQIEPLRRNLVTREEAAWLEFKSESMLWDRPGKSYVVEARPPGPFDNN